jgi:hypothetical protein
LGSATLAPTFESIREWYAEQQQAIRAGANTVGKIVFKLVWKNGAIVTRDNFNVVSGFTIERPSYTETSSSPADLPTKAVSEAGGLKGGHSIESVRV